VKRALLAAAAAVALFAAHFAWWYLPRERAVAPRLHPAGTRGGGSRPPGSGAEDMPTPSRPARVPAPATATAGGPREEPLQLLESGAYDVCLWVPYPHQNLGVLAGAIGDLQDVVGAAVRLNAGEASPRRSTEPQEAPSFGPFEVPPASELVACSDLAGGRLRVVARIYPALSVVAKLAGRLAGNPWLAGGTAGRMHIAWAGRLWSVTAGDESPPVAAAPRTAAADPATVRRPRALSPVAAPGTAAAVAVPELPESLAVVHWTGVRTEIPAGYYALTRRGQDLAVSLVGAAGAGEAPILSAAAAAADPLPALLMAVGAEWPAGGVLGAAAPTPGTVPDSPNHGEPVVGSPTNGSPIPGAPIAGSAFAVTSAVPRPLLPPAALALFETGGSQVSSLGKLPGLAVFNAAGAAGPARWRLPTEGIFRLLAGRLPASEAVGWRIVALDKDSLRQAEVLAPGLAALFPPESPNAPAAATPDAGMTAGSGTAAPAAGAASPAAAGTPVHLSMGVWLEPRSALIIVSRIRRFVEKFPLASRRQVELWRDWETVLDPLANCEHATLTAVAEPPGMRLLLQGCAAPTGPR
jgi:hypothetical protein